jgi:hypothetical protein
VRRATRRGEAKRQSHSEIDLRHGNPSVRDRGASTGSATMSRARAWPRPCPLSSSGSCSQAAARRCPRRRRVGVAHGDEADRAHRLALPRGSARTEGTTLRLSSMGEENAAWFKRYRPNMRVYRRLLEAFERA